MNKAKGLWTFSLSLDDDGRVSAKLSDGEFEGANEGEIDTFLIEGAYEIIRQSEQYAVSIYERSKHMPTQIC
jgi:hypothetical protein